MAKTGRPTSYNTEIAHAICEEMAHTDHSLRRICDAEGMPDPATVYRWLEAHEDFRERYARERERGRRTSWPRKSLKFQTMAAMISS